MRDTAGKISVLVITYNQAPVLRWLLRSLEEQDYRGDFEVIVCDDGSRDSTRSVVWESARRGILDVRYVWQPHTGNRVARSRNNGIRCAQGDILVFIDGDCILPRNWLSSHAKAHRGSGSRGRPRLLVGTRCWVDLDLENKTMRKVSMNKVHRACRKSGTYPDREQQTRLSRCRLPWAAGWTFNLSVPARPEVRFDEGMGWGSEDIELCGRLYHRHRYSFELSRKVEVFHICPPKGRRSVNPWVTGKSEHIEIYVRNLLRLVSKFPDLDVTEALWPLHYFQLDRKTGKWRKARPGEKISLPRAIAIAEDWMRS